MIFKGVKFGMILQLALGPITLFILNVAISSGFTTAIQGVLGVTIVDGLFVLAALLGIGALLNKNENIKKRLSIGGAIIMMVFGLNIILSSFGINLIPNLNFNSVGSEHAFIKAIILTSANPMTILFWAGVFSTKVVEENMSKKDMYLFGLGAVITTPFSLTLISIFGSTIKVFINNDILLILNIAVGLLLMAFAIKLLVSNTTKSNKLSY